MFSDQLTEAWKFSVLWPGNITLALLEVKKWWRTWQSPKRVNLPCSRTPCKTWRYPDPLAVIELSFWVRWISPLKYIYSYITYQKVVLHNSYRFWIKHMLLLARLVAVYFSVYFQCFLGIFQWRIPKFSLSRICREKTWNLTHKKNLFAWRQNVKNKVLSFRQV